jgi:very-short-patch-repair endonuclease
MIDDSALRVLSAQQHGLVTVHQMIERGFSRSMRGRLVDGRRWERRTPRVIALVGVPRTDAQDALATVLDAGRGAALWGPSSAAWWRIPGNRLRPFQVVRIRDRSDRADRIATSHEPVLLPEHHVVTLDGVPTVVPARTLFDIAGMQRRGAELDWWVARMARMVDTAWSMRLVSGATLHAMLDEMAARGRSGIRVMRLVLATRPISYTPPASNLEARFIKLLADAGLAPMRRQVNLGDERGWIGRVDFVDHDLPLVVEIQSERFHASNLDRQLDEDRIGRLTAAGWKVVEVDEETVWHDGRHVAERVAVARHELLERRRAA